MIKLLTCLMGMALPLPMLSVLLSTLFACSLAFRDCKKTRKSVSKVSRHTGSRAKRGSCVVGWRGGGARGSGGGEVLGVVECVVLGVWGTEAVCEIEA